MAKSKPYSRYGRRGPHLLGLNAFAGTFANSIRRALMAASQSDCTSAEVALKEAHSGLYVMSPRVVASRAVRELSKAAAQVGAKCPKVNVDPYDEKATLRRYKREVIEPGRSPPSSSEGSSSTWLHDEEAGSRAGRADWASKSEHAEWAAWRKRIDDRKRELRDKGVHHKVADIFAKEQTYVEFLDPNLTEGLPPILVQGKENPSAWVQQQFIDEVHRGTTTEHEKQLRAQRELDAEEEHRRELEMQEEVDFQTKVLEREAPYWNKAPPKMDKKTRRLFDCVSYSVKRRLARKPHATTAELRDAVAKAKVVCEKPQHSKCVKKFLPGLKKAGKSEDEALREATRLCIETGGEVMLESQELGRYSKPRRRGVATTKRAACMKKKLKSFRRQGMAHRKAFGKAAKACAGKKGKKRR